MATVKKPIKKAQAGTVVKDKTSVKKNDLSKTVTATKKRQAFKPDYRYVDTFQGEGNATKKDSTEYKEGFYKQQSNRSKGKGTNVVGLFNNNLAGGSQEYKDRTYTRDKKKNGGSVKAKDGKWMQKVSASIKKRGTKGVCTGAKFGGPTCKPGTKRYALAKTFKSIAKKKK